MSVFLNRTFCSENTRHRSGLKRLGNQLRSSGRNNVTHIYTNSQRHHGKREDAIFIDLVSLLNLQKVQCLEREWS